MSTNPSTALALPPVIERKVKPRPTKAEMIEALAIRQLHTMQAEQEELKASINKLDTELRAELRQYALDHIAALAPGANVSVGHIYDLGTANEWIRGMQFTLTLDNVPEALKRKRRAMAKLEAKRVWRLPCLHEIKKQIRRRIDQDQPLEPRPRVAQMVNDPAIAKWLDKMLADLAKPAQPKLAA